MRVLVTGGKGDLGRRLVPRLLEAGHDVRVGTRSPTARDDGAVEVTYSFDDDAALAAAVADVDTVVHLASDPTSRSLDVTAAAALVSEAREAGVGHIVFLSIVGIDGHPFVYYRTKLAAERVITASAVPWTVLRATQFHTLIARYADAAVVSPVVPVPAGFRLQPIDAEVVADRLEELVEAGPSGRVPDMGGPGEVESKDAVERYLKATGQKRMVVSLPVFGKWAEAFRSGKNLAPGCEAGGRSYEEFLADVAAGRAAG